MDRQRRVAHLRVLITGYGHAPQDLCRDDPAILEQLGDITPAISPQLWYGEIPSRWVALLPTPEIIRLLARAIAQASRLLDADDVVAPTLRLLDGIADGTLDENTLDEDPQHIVDELSVSIGPDGPLNLAALAGACAFAVANAQHAVAIIHASRPVLHLSRGALASGSLDAIRSCETTAFTELENGLLRSVGVEPAPRRHWRAGRDRHIELPGPPHRDAGDRTDLLRLTHRDERSSPERPLPDYALLALVLTQIRRCRSLIPPDRAGSVIAIFDELTDVCSQDDSAALLSDPAIRLIDAAESLLPSPGVEGLMARSLHAVGRAVQCVRVDERVFADAHARIAIQASEQAAIAAGMTIHRSAAGDIERILASGWLEQDAGRQGSESPREPRGFDFSILS